MRLSHKKRAISSSSSYRLPLFLLSFLISITIWLPSASYSMAENQDSNEEKKPLRIVSLAPNITEILFSLDAAKRIVGVTNYCNYPFEALSITKIGGFINPNLELIISLKPDLIIGSPNAGNKETLMNLKKFIDADVLLLDAENLDDFYKTIERIGQAIHEEEKASILVDHLQGKLEQMRKRTDPSERKRVLLSLSTHPVFVATSNSYPGHLASIAGADVLPSPFKDRGSLPPYFAVSLEEIIRWNPEIIIQTMMDSHDGRVKERIMKYWQQWTSISAIQNGRIYVIPGDIILRPSPRAVLGAKLLYKLIHPEQEKHARKHSTNSSISLQIR